MQNNQLAMPDVEEPRPFWQTALHFFILVGILVFVNWGKPDSTEGFWYCVFANKWFITSIFGIGFALSMAYIIKVKKTLCYSWNNRGNNISNFLLS